MPEQLGGWALRGPGRREPAQDGAGAGPVSVTRAPRPGNARPEPAPPGPGRDARTEMHSLQHVQMLLQEGDGGRGAAADVLVGEPHELAGEGHEVAGGLPVVLQRASRGGTQSRGCPRWRPCPPSCAHPSQSLTAQAGHHQAPPSAGSLRLRSGPGPRPAGAPPGGGQLGAWPRPRPPAARGSALLQGSLGPHLRSPRGFWGQTPSPGQEDRARCSCGSRRTNRLGREFRRGGGVQCPP